MLTGRQMAKAYTLWWRNNTYHTSRPQQYILVSDTRVIAFDCSTGYGLTEVYGNTYISYFETLTTLNNKILRLLQKKGRCCNDCLYKQYDTLPPSQLFNYQVLRFVHKTVYLPHLVPIIFHNYFTLNTSIHSYSTRQQTLLATCKFSLWRPVVKI